MALTEDDLGKRVGLEYGDGSLRVVGRMIGYCAEPTVCIEKADGSQEMWTASLGTVLPEKSAVLEFPQPMEG